MKGYHHETYAFPLPGADGGAGAVRWKCREPRDGIHWFDRRWFASEQALIRALSGRVAGVPEVMLVDGIGLQRFIEGATLGAWGGPGTVVAERHLRQVERLFGELAAIGPGSLGVPALSPGDTPVADGDSAGFAAELLRFTEEQVRQAHLPHYGELFGALGVPEDGLTRLAGRMRGLTPRPFCLLHADLHRENFVVDGHDRLWTIDWELAVFGDPLYELATHLHLMRYPARQEAVVTSRWREAVERVRPGSSQGWREDLPRLRAYKLVQSVYTDTVRAGMSTGDGPLDPNALCVTARKLEGLLGGAAQLLGMRRVPGVREIAAALLRRRRAGNGRAGPVPGG
ncbi:aminoglycoside phosphotransferase family protein [Streptomyces genisteinicus]|uniref:aminoglycoside phosphotransferase family protein n=1 Tax=Streptomyces genisteinicus TaxID=2768068 RepID=UPI001FE8C9B3|nr:aminoglycoside phosphotransferase family protein [Streptomyces genisteinicus]